MGVLMLLSGVVAGIIALFGLFYKFWFLRDPLRLAPSGNNIISPADGKIIEIKEIHPDSKGDIKKGKGVIQTVYSDTILHGKSGYLITIFMTPFDVHYQRAPYDGKVVYSKHKKGQFRSAEKPRPQNENNQILIRTRLGNMKVIQVSGFIARRIVSFVKENQNIKKGQKIGMIRMGSQCCLIIPKMTHKMKAELKIKKGDRLKAGETIIMSLGK
ncbi:phosphatidylserine decarboxylase family protein [Candidatus Woesearchaeota archaeon CG10_big_fil_rev_8_21_14_0_10_44_13]|nr:MAG: phosphatidylserine decarboxylase family protein [Candidatus Woesearchaeota archaeon CG10_big_fil_rev_8_21_14_0_10_44_13]